MGLSPKNQETPLSYGWDYLDNLLKSNINHPNDSATIRISNFAIPESEIISEATAKGYKVTKSDDGNFLKFE